MFDTICSICNILLELRDLVTIIKQLHVGSHLNYYVPKAQNTTQKSISIVFSVSSIRHDSSLSKYRKQKQSPPGNTKNGARPGG